jgi:hypothetical protein
MRVDEDVDVGQLHRLRASRKAIDVVDFEQRRRRKNGVDRLCMPPAEALHEMLG